LIFFIAFGKETILSLAFLFTTGESGEKSAEGGGARKHMVLFRSQCGKVGRSILLFEISHYYSFCGRKVLGEAEYLVKGG